MNDKNEPAFPRDHRYNGHNGLTKREYFAAMALQGYLASYAGTSADPKAEIIARKSIEYADALLQQLQTDNNG